MFTLRSNSAYDAGFSLILYRMSFLISAGIFLVYNIEIENLDSEPVYISSNDMKLFDKQGRKYVPDTQAMFYREDSFNFETLNPGIKQKGVVIFDVSDPKAEYELRIYDNVFSMFD